MVAGREEGVKRTVGSCTKAPPFDPGGRSPVVAYFRHSMIVCTVGRAREQVSFVSEGLSRERLIRIAFHHLLLSPPSFSMFPSLSYLLDFLTSPPCRVENPTLRSCKREEETAELTVFPLPL